MEREKLRHLQKSLRLNNRIGRRNLLSIKTEAIEYNYKIIASVCYAHYIFVSNKEQIRNT